MSSFSDLRLDMRDYRKYRKNNGYPYAMWGEVSSRIDILTKCKRKSVRVDYFGRMYVSLPNTQEKNSNCLVDRQMLENGLLF